jgi:four helix bundle protein
MGDCRKLNVWNRAHKLALASYRATLRFTAIERFGLTSQIRRAAASIPANIAEGCGRRTDGQFRHLVRIALGSATELEYQLLLARDLKLRSPTQAEGLIHEAGEVANMLAGPFRKLTGAKPTHTSHSS